MERVKVIKKDELLKINQTVIDFGVKKITKAKALLSLSQSAANLGQSKSVDREAIGAKLAYALEFIATR